jgi:hypothetical protein
MLLGKILACVSAAYGTLGVIVMLVMLARSQLDGMKEPAVVVSLAVALGIGVALVAAAVRYFRDPGRKNALSVAVAASFVLTLELSRGLKMAGLQHYVGPGLVLLCLGAGVAFHRLVLRPHVIAAFPPEKTSEPVSMGRNP